MCLAAEDAQTGWMDTELRAELLRRMEKDQAAIGAAGSGALEAVAAGKEAVLAGNLSWLKQVIAEVGGRASPWWARTGRSLPGCWPSTPIVIRRSSGGALT